MRITQNHPGLATIFTLCCLGTGVVWADTPMGQGSGMAQGPDADRPATSYPGASPWQSTPQDMRSASGESSPLTNSAARPQGPQREVSGFGGAQQPQGTPYSEPSGGAPINAPRPASGGWGTEPTPSNATAQTGPAGGPMPVPMAQPGRPASGVAGGFYPERANLPLQQPAQSMSPNWSPDSGWTAPAAGSNMQGATGLMPGSAQPSGTMAVPSTSDLSGSWRGSGGEVVEIRGNFARIWGGEDQYCNCVFMVYGDRLIAYSPDTDVVRKFEFAGNHDQFMLRDDRGQMMTFRRTQ